MNTEQIITELEFAKEELEGKAFIAKQTSSNKIEKSYQRTADAVQSAIDYIREHEAQKNAPAH